MRRSRLRPFNGLAFPHMCWLMLSTTTIMSPRSWFLAPAREGNKHSNPDKLWHLLYLAWSRCYAAPQPFRKDNSLNGLAPPCIVGVHSIECGSLCVRLEVQEIHHTGRPPGATMPRRMWDTPQ
jgi:hypothetical protein